ncbi:MAG: DUF1819 family protein [Sphingobacteriales bacterium]|nr:MAG: DUF1819 family protein [Sphingobacteriales bacterium]
MEGIYKANITAGALLVPESRKIADLMLRNVSPQEWKDEIEQKNLLQNLLPMPLILQHLKIRINRHAKHNSQFYRVL